MNPLAATPDGIPMRTAVLLTILVIATPARADVVLDWNDVSLSLVQRSSATPPVAARALAMTHVAIYDVVNSIEPTYQSFRVQYSVAPTTSREAAAASAAYRVLLHIFPSERSQLENALANSLAQVSEGPDKAAGIRLGEIVAGQVIAWREADGSQRSASYTPGTSPGQWRPTPPEFKPALLPHWSSVTPFGIKYASQFRPSLPPSLSSEEYARDFQEVRTLGAINSDARTADETKIAYFWADGPGTVTPPGHWNKIAQTVARSNGLSPRENARLFALLNVALADAAIVCWDMKFTCNFWRPITAIHEADTDGNDRTARDANWRPLLDTPPFPSCTSGHSTFSGAAAEVLALTLGRDSVPFTDISGLDKASRTYSSFTQAAEQAGRSRIYAGIHFQFDNRAGLESGHAVGRYIFDHFLQPISASRNESSASTNERSVLRIANRPSLDDGWVGESQARNQAGANTNPTQPAVTSNSGSNTGTATCCCPPPTAYACPTYVYPANTVVALYSQVPVQYYEPRVVEYNGAVDISPYTSTSFFVAGW
jgi:hypothetical protein